MTMTTDITDLAQSLKAAAEKASGGDWVKESGDGWDATCSNDDQANSGFIIAHFVGPDSEANREFVQLANPANIRALVEALEKAQAKATQQGNIACALFDEVTQLRRHADDKAPELRAQLIEADGELEALRQRIAELEEAEQKICAANVTLDARAELAERRLAEMESRTVTVKQGEVLVTVAGFTGCGKSAIAGEIEIAMKAIGVPVTWANGDAEKQMTGADWLTAIEMYKPRVRIVEENTPRAAGIKWEAE